MGTPAHYVVPQMANRIAFLHDQYSTNYLKGPFKKEGLET